MASLVLEQSYADHQDNQKQKIERIKFLKKHSCLILITYYFKTHTIKKTSFRLKEKSKDECQKTANLYRTNFEPDTIERKEVGFQWFGNP